MSESQEIKNDIALIFKDMDSTGGIAAFAFKWKMVGYCLSELIDMLSDETMIDHLTESQETELKGALMWLKSEHEHIESRWDY